MCVWCLGRAGSRCGAIYGASRQAYEEARLNGIVSLPAPCNLRRRARQGAWQTAFDNRIFKSFGKLVRTHMPAHQCALITPFH